MITINGLELPVNSIFSGGEVNIKIPDILNKEGVLVVHATLSSSDEIMKLLMVKDALDHYAPIPRKVLFMPYVPYARQDRRCHKGEAYGLLVFTELINNMGFDNVIVLDPHVPLGDYIINLYMSLSPADLIDPNVCANKVIVSPDKGGLVRASQVAEANGLRIVKATKVRENGSIVDTQIESGSEFIEGQDLLIVDDICDGGGTFIALVNELMKYNPRSVEIYVTHGIFRFGVQPLLEAGISHIYTTNSICSIQHPQVTIFTVNAKEEE